MDRPHLAWLDTELIRRRSHRLAKTRAFIFIWMEYCGVHPCIANRGPHTTGGGLETTEEISIACMSSVTTMIVRTSRRAPLTDAEVFASLGARRSAFAKCSTAPGRNARAGSQDFLERACRNSPKRSPPTPSPPNLEFEFCHDGGGFSQTIRPGRFDGHQCRTPKPYPDVYSAAELLEISAATALSWNDSHGGVAAVWLPECEWLYYHNYAELQGRRTLHAIS